MGLVHGDHYTENLVCLCGSAVCSVVLTIAMAWYRRLICYAVFTTSRQQQRRHHSQRSSTVRGMVWSRLIFCVWAWVSNVHTTIMPLLGEYPYHCNTVYQSAAWWYLTSRPSLYLHYLFKARLVR